MSVRQIITEGEKKTWIDYPAARMEGVSPGGAPIRIEISEDQLASSWIEGMVLDADDEPVEGTTYSLRRETGGGSSGIQNADKGRLRIGPVPSGRYRLFISAPGYPDVYSEWRAVASGETWKLGTIRLRKGGTIRVDLKGHIPPEGRGLWLSAIRVGGGPGGSFKVDGAVATSNQLAPGEYTLRVSGQAVAYAELPVAVTAGAEARLEVETSPGARRRFTLVDPAEDPPAEARFVVVDDTGRTVVDRTVKRYLDRPIVLSIPLGPGTYTATVTCGERRGTGELVVASDLSGPDAASITIE